MSEHDPEKQEEVDTGVHEKEHPLELSRSGDSHGEENSSQPHSGRASSELAGSNIIRTVTTSSRKDVVKIPRSHRVGLLGRFSYLYEAEEPKDYPRNVKWLITFFIALAAVAAPMGSSIIYPALNDITRAFRTDAFTANLSVALYMLAMSMFPLWWSALSESAGRRAVYLISFTIYTVFNIVAARSTSIGMFIIMRVLSGGASASVQAVGAGTVADIWEVRERGRAMGIYYIGPLCGPLIAPVLGGVLTQGLGWRSTQWFQAIFGAIMIILTLLFLPETHKYSKINAEAEEKALEARTAGGPSSRPPLSRSVSRQSIKSVKVASRKYLVMTHKIFVEPLSVIGYLRYPPIALTVYYASIAFGSLYFLNISVESTFSMAPYNFSTILVGVIYISNSLGYFLVAVLGGPWVDYIMRREAIRAHRYDERGKLIFDPQDRCRENAWLGAMLMPMALLWYGWTTQYTVFWFAPVLSLFFFGAGSMLIFGMATTMLTEFMPKKSSAGVALNNFVRNIFSFAGTMLAEPAIRGIGNGWLFTILGIVTFASCLVIVAMRRYGKKWKEEMDRSMT